MSAMLAIGNAFEGIRLVGPFEDDDVATAYAERNHDGADWTLVPYDDPVEDEDEDEELYDIVRYQRDEPSVIVEEGVTLEQAQAHCNDPSTSGDGWFDGYRRA